MITIHWTTVGDISPATLDAILASQRAVERALGVDFVQDGGSDVTYLESAVWGTSAATVGLPSAVWLLPGEDGRWALHELGHSLGLSHSSDSGMTGSVMSYQWDTWSEELGQWLIPQGFMALDIEHLVPVYGASHRNDGNTVWRPDPLVIDSVLDWDGCDTLDLSRSHGAMVDLEAGWIDHADGGRTWVLPDAIEVVRLSPGADTVALSAGDLFIGLGRDDRLPLPGEVRRVASRAVRL